MCTHLRTAIKTVSWRVFAAVDTFVVSTVAITLVSGGNYRTAAVAAVSTVGFEAITKIAWFYAHERLWESKTLSELGGSNVVDSSFPA